MIKYLAGKDKAGSLKVTFDTEAEATVTATTDPEKRYTISEVFDGTRFRSVSLSPNGKYLLTSYQTTFPGGETASYQQVTDKASGQVLVESSTNNYSWMPQSNRLYYTRKGLQGKELVSIDPVTKTETILSANLPDGWFVFAPTEDYLIFMVSEEGPKKDKDMEEIIVPDDRQPGWRNRFFLHKYDLATGLFERLTYGLDSHQRYFQRRPLPAVHQPRAHPDPTPVQHDDSLPDGSADDADRRDPERPVHRFRQLLPRRDATGY